jgi:hypothetical protein
MEVRTEMVGRGSWGRGRRGRDEIMFMGTQGRKEIWGRDDMVSGDHRARTKEWEWDN